MREDKNTQPVQVTWGATKIPPGNPTSMVLPRSEYDTSLEVIKVWLTYLERGEWEGEKVR